MIVKIGLSEQGDDSCEESPDARPLAVETAHM
jgi:hypothetical protein